MNMNVNEQDMARWAHQPETQKFLSDLVDSRQSTMEAWGRGAFSGAELSNAKALGGVDVLTQIIDMIVGLKEVTA